MWLNYILQVALLLQTGHDFFLKTNVVLHIYLLKYVTLMQYLFSDRREHMKSIFAKKIRHCPREKVYVFHKISSQFWNEKIKTFWNSCCFGLQDNVTLLLICFCFIGTFCIFVTTLIFILLVKGYRDFIF